MTALSFQTGRRHQTSPASLRGWLEEESLKPKCGVCPSTRSRSGGLCARDHQEDKTRQEGGYSPPDLLRGKIGVRRIYSEVIFLADAIFTPLARPIKPHERQSPHANYPRRILLGVNFAYNRFSLYPPPPLQKVMPLTLLKELIKRLSPLPKALG